MVGIWGLGGIGKSTIARAVCNSIAGHFERTCFLADVRENSMKQGLAHLQEMLLFDLVGEKNIASRNVHEGIPRIESRLRNKKVLLVLDDVDELEQLERLAGGTDWFGLGSRIIITTRNKRLLLAHHVVKIFEVGKLGKDEALELFSWNAFRERTPAAVFVDISKRVIHYADGLPLALKIIGSDLCGKTIDEWEDELEKYRRFPKREIFSILKVSYDNLEDNEKYAFLDIACFFKGEGLGYVIKVLDARGFKPKSAIGALVHKSLVTIERGRLRMHDLVQDMGREIVRKESIKPGRRTRLWFHEDVLQVLEHDKGTEEIQGIILENPQQEEVEWSGKAFKKMENLRILIVRNGYFSCGPEHLPNSLILLDWEQYPSPSLPPNFHPRKLIILNLPHSNLKLEDPFKKFENLTDMNLSCCDSLVKVPDVSGIPNLRKLKLDGCKNLLEIHNSVGVLNKLVELRAAGCSQLRTLPHSIKLTSLEILNIRGCSMVKRFPDVVVKIESSLTIDVAGSGIEELPSSVENLTRISYFDMSNCQGLRHIPLSIGLSDAFSVYVDVSSCPHLGKSFKSALQITQSTLSADHSTASSDAPNDILPIRFSLKFRDNNLLDEHLPFIFSCFANVNDLDLSHNNFKVLPECILRLPYLKSLVLDDCEQLQHISIPPKLNTIRARNCISLTAPSLDILLSEVFSRTEYLDVIMPFSNVPECFDHVRLDISFWFRNKFPGIAVFYIHGKTDNDSSESGLSEVQFLINGHQVCSTSNIYASRLKRDHVWLFDIRASSDDWESYMLPEWNYVQISFNSSNKKGCLLYVNEKGTNMKDILFSDPPQDSGCDKCSDMSHGEGNADITSLSDEETDDQNAETNMEDMTMPGYEYELIQSIVEEISGILNRNLPHVADYPVRL